MKLNSLLSLNAEYVFAVLAIVFGVTFLLITPPFQSPDENRHFYRAYHMSQGSMFSTRMDGRVGGYLPKKVKESLEQFSEMRGRDDRIISRSDIMKSISQNGDETMEFVDFPSMAVYTPVSYVPQAIGIRLSRLFSDSAILALYSGRLITLICWIIALFYAIRITPIFKWLFVALALLPMSVFIHASVSADTITNAVAFLLIATIFKQAFSDQKQSRKQYITLIIFVFLLASAKFLYSPLVLLFLLIPLKNMANRKQYLLRFFGLGIVALCTAASWPLIQSVGYVPYADYNPNFSDKVNLLACSDINEQLTYILEHGSYIFFVWGNSLVESFNVYYTGFIGNFGWGEVPLPSLALVFGYFGLLLIALTDGNSHFRMSRSQRLILFVPFSINFALVITSQLLIWTCVGSDVVDNLQGRYLIPFAPLLFFIFYRSSSRFMKFLPIGTIVFSSILLITSTVLIYKRFYVPKEYSTETVFCDHEKERGTAEFGTSEPTVFAGNGFSRSDEKSRSGSYSSKLSAEIKYGTIITFDNCNGGDKIEVEAWRNGPNGMIIISSEGGEEFFDGSKEVQSTSGDWQQIKFWRRIPTPIENEKISCYLAYFDEADSCYFDDVKVTLRRLK